MPGILIDVPVQPAPLEPPRRRWTRSDCEVLETSGLPDHERLELVEGELIGKMGKKRPHINTQALLQEWLVAVFGFRLVNIEAPIDVAPQDNEANEPEPDAIVLKREVSFFAANPQPDDLRLVVEVSHSARLYARVGNVEYRVIDIRGRRLIVHRDPLAAPGGNLQGCGRSAARSRLTSPARAFTGGRYQPSSFSLTS